MKSGIGGPPRAVYTALIGNYDQLSPIKFRSSIKFVVFTDNSALSVRGWEKRDIADLSGLPRGMPNWMINRYLKMHPHVFLPEFEETLYVDANIQLLRDPAPLFDVNLSNGDIAIPYHMERGDMVGLDPRNIIRSETGESRSIRQVDFFEVNKEPLIKPSE